LFWDWISFRIFFSVEEGDVAPRAFVQPKVAHLSLEDKSGKIYAYPPNCSEKRSGCLGNYLSIEELKNFNL
jgi:hypothetical protein